MLTRNNCQPAKNGGFERTGAHGLRYFFDRFRYVPATLFIEESFIDQDQPGNTQDCPQDLVKTETFLVKDDANGNQGEGQKDIGHQ
jgi:hypothetical protein